MSTPPASVLVIGAGSGAAPGAGHREHGLADLSAPLRTLAVAV